MGVAHACSAANPHPKNGAAALWKEPEVMPNLWLMMDRWSDGSIDRPAVCSRIYVMPALLPSSQYG